MSTAQTFSLERLEFLAYARRHEEAAREIIRLLQDLDASLGRLSEIGGAPSGDLAADLRDAHLATRIASAVGALFSDPGFRLSALGFERLIPLQRWLAIVFGASPLGNADHIIRLFNKQGYDKPEQITLEDHDLLKFSLLYSLDSDIPVQPEVLWEKNKELGAALFFALLSSRMVASPQAGDKKEQLLKWLPPRLGDVPLDAIPIGIVHDVWMHCSYAYGEQKHSIKRAINQLVRHKLLASGFSDVSTVPAQEKRRKPVVLCILEWFGSDHAMYRGHAPLIESLKAKFHVVGVSMRESTDELARKTFDEVHVLPKTNSLFDTVRQVVALAATIKPDIVHYPSAGMFPDTIFLINLRLAPIQTVAMGHPATTHSPFIDYAVVCEDTVGDPKRFSEKVLALPPLPQRAPPKARRIPPRARNARGGGDTKVAVAASLMKLNSRFLGALRQIAEGSKVKIEFRLYSGMAFGLAKVYLQNLIRRIVGDYAVLYPHLPYDTYIGNLNECDMFLDPFPFGNATGIVDTVRQGLPGVCLTGPELHSHVDEALFKWLGLPPWTIAKSEHEYVKAAIRMAEDAAEREKLGKQLLKSDPDAILFKGDASPFCDAFEWVLVNHEHLKAEPAQLLRPPTQKARPARR